MRKLWETRLKFDGQMNGMGRDVKKKYLDIPQSNLHNINNDKVMKIFLWSRFLESG